ncbi:heterokaryon incompatibility protein-domain-containing protein [Xylariaceae sp. FL1651]|nr:heterokaryon incompatibility protein-domain-containing protein [Xylariaceae sp. FL1651]
MLTDTSPRLSTRGGPMSVIFSQSLRSGVRIVLPVVSILVGITLGLSWIVKRSKESRCCRECQKIVGKRDREINELVITSAADGSGHFDYSLCDACNFTHNVERMVGFEFDQAEGVDLSPLKGSLCLTCWETMERNFGIKNARDFFEESEEYWAQRFANPSAVEPKDCDHCRLMQEATQAMCDDETRLGSAVYSKQCVDGYTIIVAPMLGPDRRQLVSGQDSQDDCVELEVLTPPEIALPWPGYKTARKIARYANSVECLEKINGWIEECSATHPACAPISGDGPRRLIDTGPLGEDAFVKLVDWPVSDTEPVKYCALSYCWGSDQRWHFTTTRETEKLRRQHIPVDQLPPTLRDAVLITRAVGCQYLWVDALCIIQLDKSDWESESLRMASIYGNAFLVIAATESNSPGDGIFAPRPAVVRFDFHRAGKIYPVHVRRRDDHSTWRQRARVVSSSPVPRLPVLHTRAWAFQERMLACRVVHFTSNELVWECNTHCRCECSELDGKGSQNKFSEGRSLKTFFAETSEPQRTWETVVESYSVRQLTVATDLLPALSGLARRLSSPELGTYLAGLWSSQLPDALLWYTFDSQRTKEYRAPSWSWASHTGEVRVIPEMGYQYGNICAEVLSAECCSAGGDPYGAVTDGYLVLKGELKSFDRPQDEEHREVWALRVRERQAVLLERSQRVDGAWEMIGSDYMEDVFNGNGTSIVKIV